MPTQSPFAALAEKTKGNNPRGNGPSAAPAAKTKGPERGDKHPIPILRGWRRGATTVLLFAHDVGEQTHGRGFVNTGTGNRNVIFFFNEKDGKKSITLKEFVPANDGEGGGQWNVVGFGNALNHREDGRQVFFDTVLFNVGGKVLEARITRAGEAFRDQIGFAQARIERPKVQAAIPVNAWMSEWELIEAVRKGRIDVEDLADAQRTQDVCLAAVQHNGRAIRWLTDAQRTPQVCLSTVQNNSYAVEHLTPEQCAQPLISDWIMENWRVCARILGDERAQEVAQAILASRQGSEETERVQRMGG